MKTVKFYHSDTATVGGKTLAPKSPHPNPKGLWTHSVTWQGEPVFTTWRLPCVIQGPRIITRCLTMWLREAREREV